MQQRDEGQGQQTSRGRKWQVAGAVVPASGGRSVPNHWEANGKWSRDGQGVSGWGKGRASHGLCASECGTQSLLSVRSPHTLIIYLGYVSAFLLFCLLPTDSELPRQVEGVLILSPLDSELTLNMYPLLPVPGAGQKVGVQKRSFINHPYPPHLPRILSRK